MKKLERELGLFSVCAIACGAMLSGLFVLPGHAALIGGPSVYLAFMVAGLLFVPAALSKAEMATALPEAGGDYIFIDRAMGPVVSTITGMGTWLALMLKSAFALVGLSAYLFLIVDLPPVYLKYFACGVGAFLVFINCIGVKKTGQLQSILVVVSLLTLVVFVERGAIEVNSDYYKPMFSEGWLGFISATAFVFVSYAGVTKVASAAEEIMDPGTNIPWGMLLSLTVMILLYTAVVFVVIGVVPGEDMAKGIYKNAPIAQAAMHFSGRIGEVIISIVAVMSLAAMANAGLLASSRYPLALSRYDQLPEVFSRIHSRFKTPMLSILVTGGSIILSIIFLPVVQLAKLASAFMLLVFSLVNLSVIIFREGDIEWYRPEFRSPFYPYVQLFGIVSSLALIGFMGWLTIGGSAILIAVGLTWYLVYARKRADRVGVLFRPEASATETISAEIEVFESFRSKEEGKRSIIVPFFELEEEDIIFAERRIQLGVALCGEGEYLDVVHFEEVAEQSLLSEHQPDEELNTQLEERIRLLQQDVDVRINYDVVLTHHSHGSLRRYAEEELPHWLLYRWKTPSPWQFLLGKREWWLADFPTNMAFFNDNGRVEFDDVLVVTEPGPYDGEVVNAADLIAEHYGGEVTFVNPLADSEKAKRFVNDYHSALTGMCDSPSHSLKIPADDWVSKVLERCESADLLVVGGLTEDAFPDFPAQEYGERIEKEADCSVLRVRSNLKTPETVMDRPEKKFSDVTEHIDPARVKTGRKVRDKEALFENLAGMMAEETQDRSRIEEALWKRENQQHTYIDRGVAFPHGIPDESQSTRIGILVLEDPIPYTDEGEEASVFVVIVGPPGERDVHLNILSDLAELFVETELYNVLRRTREPEEIISTLKDFINQLENS